MRCVNIWAVALASALTFACGDRDVADNNATATDQTAVDRAPGATNPAATANRTAPDAAAPTARANDMDARALVEKMGHVNAAEIKLGQLAADHAADAQVKQFGRRMVAEHQKANAELKQVAAKVNAQAPADLDAKHQELYDRLSKLKGAEFDREYIKAMVEGHQEVASELERHADAAARPGDRSVGTTGAAADADAPVKAWAAKTLPDVRQHLEQARQIEGKLSSR